MSIKQDYILKIIEQIIEILLEKAYGIKSKEEVKNSFFNCEKNTQKFQELKDLVDDKKVNPAENKLFEYLEENSEDNLKLALLFYDYLNKKTDNFLDECDFTREEIKEGLKDISKKYGYENIINIYLL